MTITKRITLSEEEQELFEQIQDILTLVYNEEEVGEKENKISKLQSDLNEFCYEYGSNYYREYH